MKKFENEAKIVIAGREHYDDDQASKFVYYKRWEKGGNRRIYVNDYKRRTYGYIDMETREYVEIEHNNNIEETVTRFMAEYEF